ncbi:EF-hand domain-containing protein 1 [Irineochytrium annulatum]|nr:EF-hand domain-containing protein 1 [Irineochytrium annulatum]
MESNTPVDGDPFLAPVEAEFAIRLEELVKREEAVAAREESAKAFWANDLRVDPVVLRVGDRLFHTSRDVLLSQADSFFSGLLSDNFKKNEGEPFFIPREAGVFEHVLSFLIYGEVLMPLTDLMRRKVIKDAEFYGLTALVQALGGEDLTEHEGGDIRRGLLELKQTSSWGAPLQWAIATIDSELFVLTPGEVENDSSGVYMFQVCGGMRSERCQDCELFYNISLCLNGDAFKSSADSSTFQIDSPVEITGFSHFAKGSILTVRKCCCLNFESDGWEVMIVKIR